MNILLVNNIASYNSNIALSLNKIENINAKYLIFEEHKYHSSNPFQIVLKKFPSRKNPISYIYHKLTFKRKIKKWIKWCDVVYYLWDNILDEYDLELAHKLNKKIYIEWVGSDIRNPHLLSLINPYYREKFNNGYTYKELEASNFKNVVQEKFAKYNAKVFCCPEMSMYVRKDLFPNCNIIFKRFNLEEHKVSSINENNKVKIVHSPSAPQAKGTDIINEAIKILEQKYDLEYILLTNMSRDEVIKNISSSDIFIDQIIIGAYGMASVEAMSFGIPVLCYILPQLFEHGLPKECPIVNANPDNIKEKLEELIVNPALRKEIGEKSRKYVEDFHDSDKIALQLIEIFKKIDE